MSQVNNFVSHAAANWQFHEKLCTNFPEEHFDWKITLLFYTALHWLQSLAAKKSIEIGNTHFDVENAVKPNARRRQSSANIKMPISVTAWDNYSKLQDYSRSARYYSPSMTLPDFHAVCKTNHEKCLKHLADFKKYIQAQGVPVAPPADSTDSPT